MRGALLTLLLLAGVARAQPVGLADPAAPTVTVRAERSKAQLGESFHVWITVLHHADSTITLPTNSDLGGVFEVLDREELSGEEPDGLLKTTYDLTVAGFQLGKQAFPSFEVGYTVDGEVRRVSTDALQIELTSVIGDGKEELRPIAPPVDVLQRDWRILWIACGAVAALLLIGIGWTMARRARRRRVAASDPEVLARNLPPEEAALQRLRALAGQLDVEDVRPVFFALTDIVREYLGRRYGFDALELTTSELLETLDRRAGALAARDEIASWLDECDLVKYARVPVGRDDAVRALERAITIVERTRPSVLPAPAPAPAPGAPAPPSPTPEATG